MANVKYEKVGSLKLMRIENEFADFAVFPEHGAHIAEFAPKGSEDLLWMSAASRFEPGSPVRGGVPICWPWFGAHPSDETKPSHGFARTVEWKLDRVEDSPDGSTRLELSLASGDETLALWPYEFKLTLEIAVSASLAFSLTTLNTGDEPFEITQALHSYFNVGNAEKIKISGLDGARYIDTIDGDSEKIQSGDVEIHSEVDRVYLDTKAECVIEDPDKRRRIRVSKTGSSSTVVWNPWTAKSARMPDFGNDEYLGMVCVETTNAMSDSRVVAPGEAHVILAVIAETRV